MSYILPRITRIPKSSTLRFQQITRSYCYKPIERKIFAAKEPSMFEKNQKKKRDWGTSNIINGYTPGQIRPNRDLGRSLKIIESLPSDSKDITEYILLETFEKLGKNIGPISDEALVHDNFIALIEATETILPMLTVTQNVQIFKQICRAKICMFDELSELVVNKLIRRANLLTIDEIIDVDMIIREYYRSYRLSGLFDLLRQTIRHIFTIEMAMEKYSTANLMRIMAYLSNNLTLVDEKRVDVTRLYGQLLSMDDEQIQLKDAVCVIVLLSRFEQLNEDEKRVLDKMFRIWCNVARDADDVTRILGLMDKNCHQKGQLSPINNSEFLQKCTEFVIKRNDMKMAFQTLKEFNNLELFRTELIDFVSAVFIKNKRKMSNIVKDLIIFCSACELANYRPPKWDSKIEPQIKLSNFDNCSFQDQVDLSKALAGLGIYHEKIVDRLMKMESEYDNEKESLEIIRNIFSKDKKTISRNEISTTATKHLNKSKLMRDIEKFVGTKHFLSNVKVNDELTVPIVLKLNTSTRHFSNMRKTSVEENLRCNSNEVLIGVLTYKLNMEKTEFTTILDNLNKQRDMIKQKGWIGIALDENLYGNFETYRRAFIFYKIIDYALKNRSTHT